MVSTKTLRKQPGSVSVESERMPRVNRFFRKESNLDILDNLKEVPGWGCGSAEAVKKFFDNETGNEPSGLTHDDDELYYGIRRALDPMMPGERTPVPEMMQGIMYRAKMQSTIFAIFMQMVEMGLLTTDGLCRPIDLQNVDFSNDIPTIHGALMCFSLFSDMEVYARDGLYLLPFGGYRAPGLWLATVLVRGAAVTDFHYMIERMRETCPELGLFNKTKLDEHWPSASRPIRVDSQAGVPKTIREPESVCCWLPRNLTLRTSRAYNLRYIYHVFDELKFQPFEKLFFEFFGLPTNPGLPNELLPASLIAERHLEESS